MAYPGVLKVRKFQKEIVASSIRPKKPSLNTQSCIKGLLMVRDICFWAVWAAGPVLKKKVWANYEQLLRAVFQCFHEQDFFF